MNKSRLSTAMEALAMNALETRFENIDSATLEQSKNRIIDTFGCLIGGARTSGNLELVGLVKEWGGREEATVLAHGGKVPVQNAAMLNCIMVRSLDFESCGLMVGEPPVVVGAHISGTTVMTGVAVGEMTGASGRELVTAILVGEDVVSRVTAATYGRASPVAGSENALGAAAIAGRLLGLNGSQMRNALGIALEHAVGVSSQSMWEGATTFKLFTALSAQMGIFSAQLAGIGWTGPKDVLLGRCGSLSPDTEGLPDAEILLKDLGKKYHSNIIIKAYPCCGLAQGAVDCALKIVRKHDIEAGDIREVTVYVSREGLEDTVGRPFRIGDYPCANALYSYQYTVADAFIRKSVRPEHFLDESIGDERINSLVSRIRVAELPGVPSMGAKLEVIMNDGRKFSELTEFPIGNQLENPMTKDEIFAKFRDNVEFSGMVNKENAEKLLQLLDRLEQLDNIDEVIRLSVT